MNLIKKKIVNKQLNSMTPGELMKHAQKNDIELSHAQAQSVVQILQTEKIDVGNPEQVERMIIKLQTETDNHVAQTIEQLLQEYGHYIPK